MIPIMCSQALFQSSMVSDIIISFLLMNNFNSGSQGGMHVLYRKWTCSRTQPHRNFSSTIWCYNEHCKLYLIISFSPLLRNLTFFPSSLWFSLLDTLKLQPVFFMWFILLRRVGSMKYMYFVEIFYWVVFNHSERKLKQVSLIFMFWVSLTFNLHFFLSSVTSTTVNA